MKIKQSYLKVGLVLTALTLLPLAHPAIAGDEVPYKGKEVGDVTSRIMVLYSVDSDTVSLPRAFPGRKRC